MFEIVARINTADGIITPCVREDFSRYHKFVSTCECEICHQNRRRDSLVVIREEDGSEKVAGLGCLRRLYGKEAVAKARQAADESEAFMKEYYVNVELYVNMAEDIQQLRGFTSKAKAKESGDPKVVSNADLLEIWDQWPRSSEYENIKAYFDTLEPTTDFIFSAKNVLNNEWATKKAISIIPAIVNAYHRHLEDVQRKSLLSGITKAYGNVGDKFNGSLKVTLVGKYTVSGMGFCYHDDGDRKVYVFKTENGELIAWKDSKWYQDLPIELGDTVILKSFRVKNQFVSKTYGNVSMATYLKMDYSKDTKAYGNVGDKFEGSLEVTLVAKHVVGYHNDIERTVYVFKTENDELITWKNWKNSSQDPEILPVEISDTVILKSFYVKTQIVFRTYGTVSMVTDLDIEYNKQ